MTFKASPAQADMERVIFHNDEIGEFGLPTEYNVYYLITTMSPNRPGHAVSCVISLSVGALEPRDRCFYDSSGSLEAAQAKAFAALKSLPCNLGLTCDYTADK